MNEQIILISIMFQPEFISHMFLIVSLLAIVLPLGFPEVPQVFALDI